MYLRTLFLLRILDGKADVNHAYTCVYTEYNHAKLVGDPTSFFHTSFYGVLRIPFNEQQKSQYHFTPQAPAIEQPREEDGG
jgi:hypothetical protein